MSSISSIALSGMTAAQVSLQASASNLANMDDAAPLPGSGVAGPKPYAPIGVSQINVGSSGVQAQLSANPSGDSPAYDPSNPYADGSGMVSTPDIDVGAEVAGRQQALQQYRFSAAMLDVQKRMDQTTLDMVS